MNIVINKNLLGDVRRQNSLSKVTSNGKIIPNKPLSISKNYLSFKLPTYYQRNSLNIKGSESSLPTLPVYNLTLTEFTDLLLLSLKKMTNETQEISEKRAYSLHKYFQNSEKKLQYFELLGMKIQFKKMNCEDKVQYIAEVENEFLLKQVTKKRAINSLTEISGAN